jgi:hypothetical protein
MNWQPRRELEATPSQHFPIIWPYEQDMLDKAAEKALAAMGD